MTAELAKAMIAVQSQLTAVPKDAKGYNYQYQTLDSILNMARPVLSANGLVLIQQITKAERLGHVAIRTTIMHESGESVSDVAEIPIPQGKGMNEAQQAGSAITYLRRYSVSALLGTVSEMDNDGEVVKQKRNGRGKQDATRHDHGQGPLPDDEQIIMETPASEFFVVATGLIDRYTHVNHTKNAAKQLGYTSVPGVPDERRLMYLRLKNLAQSRNDEDEKANEKPLFDEPITNGAYHEAE